MKRFKTISTTFIIVIAVIFGCNVYYLVSLYNSIRNDVEREVMTAIADADLDELWIRAKRAQAGTQEALEKNMETIAADLMARPLYIKIQTEIWWRPPDILTEL